jgi:hypothetical protein
MLEIPLGKDIITCCGNSYFRMGWDWVKTALDNGWLLIRHVRFTHSRAPDPATASRKQHEQRTYRIEFKIHTYLYIADWFCQSTRDITPHILQFTIVKFSLSNSGGYRNMDSIANIPAFLFTY